MCMVKNKAKTQVRMNTLRVRIKWHKIQQPRRELGKDIQYLAVPYQFIATKYKNKAKTKNHGVVYECFGSIEIDI